MNHPHVSHPSRPFLGDFEMLPVAAHFAFGEVPLYPTSNDFQLAAMLYGDSHDAAALWQLEAIRERRVHPNRALEAAKGDIAQRVAGRLHKICTD